MADGPLPDDIKALEGDELVDHLTAVLLKDLTRRLRTGKASTELLGIARALLKDMGTGAVSQADQKALRVIHRLFVRALVAAVKERPTAAVLSEARHFLKDSGFMPARASQSEVLTKLEHAAVPFGPVEGH